MQIESGAAGWSRGWQWRWQRSSRCPRRRWREPIRAVATSSTIWLRTGSSRPTHTGCQSAESVGDRVQSVRPRVDLGQWKRILDRLRRRGRAAVAGRDHSAGGRRDVGQSDRDRVQRHRNGVLGPRGARFRPRQVHLRDRGRRDRGMEPGGRRDARAPRHRQFGRHRRGVQGLGTERRRQRRPPLRHRLPQQQDRRLGQQLRRR